VRPTGGHAVALQWSMGALYGVAPGDVWWAASDIGWVVRALNYSQGSGTNYITLLHSGRVLAAVDVSQVGHSYIVYGPLLNGSTTVLYEGKPGKQSGSVPSSHTSGHPGCWGVFPCCR
jgi:propionyl-CoA synthetase